MKYEIMSYYFKEYSNLAFGAVTYHAYMAHGSDTLGTLSNSDLSLLNIYRL